MALLTSRKTRKHSAFTLVEMLVVLLIITILIGIGLAVGTQVENSADANLTKTELKNLQAGLNWYIHKSGGQIPQNMGQFLQDYQLDHATPGPTVDGNPTWKQTPNVLTALPANLVITGTFPGPGPSGSGTMTGVICVLDGFGNPIQYMPSGVTQANVPLYANPTSNTYATSSTAWLAGATSGGGTAPPPAVDALPSITISASTFQGGTWQPSAVHAPYFYSFGPKFSAAQANTSGTSTFGPSDYIYSYNQ